MKKLAMMLLIALAAVSMAAVVSTTAECADEITFKFAMVDPETSPYYKGAAKIAEEVAAATNGKIKIKIVAGGTLGGERDTVELAMTGDIDIATAANSVMTNFIPEMSILDQAFLWDNAKQAHAAVDGPIGELIQAKANKLGLHVVGYMESGFRNVFSAKPISAMEHFKGVKIRTMQNNYHMAAFSSFGAMPVAMAAGEQFTALQQGTINAAENAIANCWNNGFYEVVKNITYTNHAFVYILLCMSDNAWNKIPADLREPFLAAVKRGCDAERQYLVDANEEATVKLKGVGVVFHNIDNNVLKAAYKKAAAEKGWKFDPAWQAAVDKVLATVK